MTTLASVVRQQGEGEKLWFAGGGLFTMKITAQQSGGTFFLLEDDMVRGKVTPLHSHPRQDETLYVIEGEILVHVEGEEQRRVSKGGVFYAPRGVVHAFMVTSESARILGVIVPGDGEEFYREVSDPVRSEEDAVRPPDFDRLLAAARRSPHIEIAGPPPFPSPTGSATAPPEEVHAGSMS